MAIGMGVVLAVAADGRTRTVVVGLLVVAVVLVARRVAVRLALRRSMTRTLAEQWPQWRSEHRAQVRAAVPLWRRVGPRRRDLPVDPFAMTVPVVVPPLGDGRPGERLMAPCPNAATAEIGVDGSRTDVTVRVAPGAALNVVCFGRVGARHGGEALGPASARPDSSRRKVPSGWLPVGDVYAVSTPAGLAWRHTMTTGRATLTDTHVDRDGWAFAVGVITPAEQPWLARVADAVLATWQWIDDVPQASCQVSSPPSTNV